LLHEQRPGESGRSGWIKKDAESSTPSQLVREVLASKFQNEKYEIDYKSVDLFRKKLLALTGSLGYKTVSQEVLNNVAIRIMAEITLNAPNPISNTGKPKLVCITGGMLFQNAVAYFLMNVENYMGKKFIKEKEGYLVANAGVGDVRLRSTPAYVEETKVYKAISMNTIASQLKAGTLQTGDALLHYPSSTGTYSLHYRVIVGAKYDTKGNLTAIETLEYHLKGRQEIVSYKALGTIPLPVHAVLRIK